MKNSLVILLFFSLAGCGLRAPNGHGPVLQETEPQEGHGGDIVAAQFIQMGYEIQEALNTETLYRNQDKLLVKAKDVEKMGQLLRNLPVFTQSDSRPIPGGSVISQDVHHHRILLLDRTRFQRLAQPVAFDAEDYLRYAFPRAVLRIYLQLLGLEGEQPSISSHFTSVSNFTVPSAFDGETFRERGHHIWSLLTANPQLVVSYLDLGAFKKVVEETPVVETSRKVIDKDSGMEVDAVSDDSNGHWVVYYNPSRIKAREISERGFTLLVFHEYSRVLGVEKIDDNYRVSHLLPPLGDLASSDN